MSNTIRCDRCHRPVRRGEAHIRSRAFEQVGWCGPCFKVLEHKPWYARLLGRFFPHAA